MLRSGRLFLANGKTFSGSMFSKEKGCFSGEVVFTTGMTGYEESLTDPSYFGQILTFTYPLIGNYGISPKERWESEKIHAVGVIVGEGCVNWSHSQSSDSLLNWLEVQGVPILTGVDTRALTKELREAGVMLGAISTDHNPPTSFFDPNQTCLSKQVSIQESEIVQEGKIKLIVVDQGMKRSMLKFLSSYPFHIKRVPYEYDYTEEPFEGVFYSNGPGDPSQLHKSVAVLQKAMEKKRPIFGVCLGAQIMALAAGATTYKLPYGHRGHNQPCLEVKTGKCFITSQNHGFAVDEQSLPKGWSVTFKNLNDHTVEGIAHDSLPFWAVQFHPEASPGPTDTRWLFEQFAKKLTE